MDLADFANEEIENQMQAMLSNFAAPPPSLNGECRQCGTPIPVARRRALPHATQCVDCAELAERHKRSYWSTS